MKIGILSDIHGDFLSLQNAIQFFKDSAVDVILCAGDLVEKGDRPNEVVAKLKELEVPCVQGNHDANAVRHDQLNSALQVPGEVPLERATIQFLATLPPKLTLEFCDKRILLTHAIPSHSAGCVFHHDDPGRLSKTFKKDLARNPCDIAVVGHTHSPFDVTFRGKRVINPGSTCRLKTRDSHTVGVLDLAQGKFDVFSLADESNFEIRDGEVI